MKHLILGWMLMLLVTLAGCSASPATGRMQFNVMNESQEVNLGEQASPEFIEGYGGEIPSPEIRQFVSDLGQRLAAASERPELPWEFFVLDSQVINAFALPGGKVFMSRGLLSEMENEAQLAGVLGHEIGHVTDRHIGTQMSQAIGVQVGLTLLGVAAQASEEEWLQVLGAAGAVGGNMYLLSFGREQENVADELGVRYMAALGYNPLGQVQVMEILRTASEGRGGTPEFLSTHPLPETRINRLEQHIAENYPGYNDPQRYSFHEERFRREVLDRLRNLPPPRHTAEDRPAPQQLQPQSRLERQKQRRRSGQAGGLFPLACDCGSHAAPPALTAFNRGSAHAH